MKKLKGSYFSYALLYAAFLFGTGIFSAILSVYLSGQGKSSVEISMIISASGVFTILLQPLIGIIFDRKQKDKQISYILLLLSAVSGLAFSFVKNTLLLFLFNGLAISLLNSINPVCERMTLASKYQYGKIRIWAAIGYALASQMGGWAYEHIAPQANFYLFVLAAGCTAFALFLIDDIPAAGRKTTQKTRDILLTLLKNRQFLLFAVISFLFSGSTAVNNTYLPLLLQSLLKSVTFVGTILFFGTLMELPVSLSSGRFMDRLSAGTLLRIDYLLLILQFSIYAFLPSVAPVAAVLFICKCTATLLFIMLTLRVVLTLVDSRCSVTALSIIATTKALGSVVMHNIAGFVCDAYGLHSVFFLLLMISLLGFVFTFFLHLSGDDNLFAKK